MLPRNLLRADPWPRLAWLAGEAVLPLGLKETYESYRVAYLGIERRGSNRRLLGMRSPRYADHCGEHFIGSSPHDVSAKKRELHAERSGDDSESGRRFTGAMRTTLCEHRGHHSCLAWEWEALYVESSNPTRAPEQPRKGEWFHRAE